MAKLAFMGKMCYPFLTCLNCNFYNLYIIFYINFIINPYIEDFKYTGRLDDIEKQLVSVHKHLGDLTDFSFKLAEVINMCESEIERVEGHPDSCGSDNTIYKIGREFFKKYDKQHND